MDSDMECPACSQGEYMDELRDRIKGRATERAACSWCMGTGRVSWQDGLRHGREIDRIYLAQESKQGRR